MIFIFGPAGSGKSTQASALAERLGREFRSVGEICREKFTTYTTNGDMVPESELATAIKAEIDAVLASGKDLVFDGQPWSPDGARIMLEKGIMDGVEVIILLEVPRAELLSRLSSRGRADDRLEVWEKKIDMYNSRITPFISVFKSSGIRIAPVSGLGTPTAVTDHIIKVLNKE